MSDWHKNIAAITLFVEDPGRAKAFYQKVFELQPAHEEETEVMFRLDNTLLFLTKSSEAPRMIAPAVAGAPGNGPRHVFAIIVDDVDAVCAELQRRGSRCSTAHRIAPGGCGQPTSKTQTATSGRSPRNSRARQADS